MFLEMNNCFLWDTPPPLPWEEALQPWSEKSSKTTIRPVSAPGRPPAGQAAKAIAGVTQIRPVLDKLRHIVYARALSPKKPDPPHSLTLPRLGCGPRQVPLQCTRAA